MPVAVYLRVSTEEQRERQSIDTQRDFAAAIATCISTKSSPPTPTTA